MTRIISKIQSLFGFSHKQTAEESSINDILDEHFVRLQNVDPDTQRQWFRLRRRLAERETEVHSRKPGFAPRFALGVALVVLVIVGGYVYFTSTHTSFDKFITGKGEKTEITLSDGSQVTLDYATELVVEEFQSEKARRVSLSGEAYFHVQRNGTPLIVSTQYGDVQVIGTEFDLRAREGMLEVGVNNGVVKVSVVKDGRDSTLLLTEHQMARCLLNNFPQRIEDISSSEYPGWMHGKLLLDKTQFQAVCREIEMRFNIAITIEDRDVQDRLVSGILDAKTADSAMRALCELTEKRFTHENQAYHIY